jgi:hypothetical protein
MERDRLREVGGERWMERDGWREIDGGERWIERVGWREID